MFACANKIGRNFNNSISFYWSPSNWREGGISRYFYRRSNCLSSSWFSINLASKDNNILNEVNLATLLPNTAWKVSVSLRSEYGEIPSVIPYSIWMREIPTRKNSAFGHFWRSESLYVTELMWMYECNLNHNWSRFNTLYKKCILTFTEEILHGKLCFLCSDTSWKSTIYDRCRLRDAWK